MTTKKRRKLFLNEFCAAFKISSLSDPRRSDAATVFIAYGEKQTRAWLAQAGGDLEVWDGLVDIKKARNIASKMPGRKKDARRKRRIDPVGPRNIRPTFISKDETVEMTRLYRQLYGRERLSYTRRAALKAQIALLKDESAAPTF